SPADDRLPVPDEAAQKAAAELVQEVFGDQIKTATGPDQKLALTKRLIEEARKSGDDPAARYALYRAALVAARDASAAMSVIEEMAKHFQIDEVKAGTFTLLRISKSVKPRSEQGILAEACLKLVDVCLAEDRFAAATKLGELAHSAALKSGDTDLRRSTRKTTEKISALQKRFQDVQAAVAVLKANPVNAKANLTVGHYYCLVKGDWERGIPMLALGSDEGLKELATHELKLPATSKEQVALADGWYLAAEKPGEADNERLLQRAAHWYRLSLKSDPALTGLLKTKVTKRLTSVESRLGELAPPATAKPPVKKEKLVIGLARILQGQKGPIRSVAWSPDGKRLASG
ncbi:MAG: WD40 repeat domain-containing protein, partial [Planctomycetota bacterium]|nr:WD40 repeat domain-containing protein [Planctomycetota bacterium]